MTRVTIADVARYAGVSKTVAFNYAERPGQATLERVLHVAHNLGCAPHPTAPALSVQRSGTKGLLIAQGPQDRLCEPRHERADPEPGQVLRGTRPYTAPGPAAHWLTDGTIFQAFADSFISLGLTRRDPALSTLTFGASRLDRLGTQLNPGGKAPVVGRRRWSNATCSSFGIKGCQIRAAT